MQDRPERCSRRLPLERPAARCHLVEHHSKREQICTSVQRLARNLFRRHIVHRPHRTAGGGQIILGESVIVGANSRLDMLRIHSCQPEIENLCVAALGHKDVGRLDVSMNDAAGVGGVQRVGDLDGEA